MINIYLSNENLVLFLFYDVTVSGKDGMSMRDEYLCAYATVICVLYMSRVKYFEISICISFIVGQNQRLIWRAEKLHHKTHADSNHEYYHIYVCSCVFLIQKNC